MKKHSVQLFSHPTSILIEDEFWIELKKIADSKNSSVQKIIEEIDRNRRNNNLASAIRIFILSYHVQKDDKG